MPKTSLWLLLLHFSIGLFLPMEVRAQEQDEFQKWLQKDQQSFQQFITEEDRAFADFLKQDWQAFQAQKGIKTFRKPKPVSIPKAPERKPTSPKVPGRKVSPLPTPLPKPRPLASPVPKPLPAVKTISFTYYGQQLILPVAKKIRLTYTLPLDNRQIGKAWLTLAAYDQKATLQQLRSYKSDLALNDWGFVQLVHEAASKLIGEDPLACVTYTWFLLNKLGYNAKLAFKPDRVFLLLPSKNLMYERPFVVIDGEKYYFITFGTNADLRGKILTYRGTYKNADHSITLTIHQLPLLPQSVKKREVHFTYAGKAYIVPLEFDAEVVSFFKAYPQTELRLYFQAPASSYLKYSLINNLRDLVRGKSEVEAVNILLRFIQKGFRYETDDQQFGHEKYMLPDETVFYPACDCEDRAVLFAYLVRNLLGLEVIGLDYPNHIATAVHFHGTVPGQGVEYNGKRFVICDPTYINADAGMTMPEFANVRPKIITF